MQVKAIKNRVRAVLRLPFMWTLGLVVLASMTTSTFKIVREQWQAGFGWNLETLTPVIIWLAVLTLLFKLCDAIEERMEQADEHLQARVELKIAKASDEDIAAAVDRLLAEQGRRGY